MLNMRAAGIESKLGTIAYKFPEPALPEPEIEAIDVDIAEEDK
jgi:hypothetical protein